jgi:FKBP-type peptidyl-prolyl cis-trans isomerase FklB
MADKNGPAASKTFLEENKKKEGVITLASGLQYKVLQSGKGFYHPTVDSPCDCHYAGTLIDGTEFDSSYKRGQPTTFAPNQVIKGWTESMQLMVEGDKWEMYIPSELGYGAGGSPPKIPGGATLIFTMEIIKIKGDKKMKAVEWTADQLALWTDADEEKCNAWRDSRVKMWEDGQLRDKHPTREGFDAWLAKQCLSTKNKTLIVRVTKLNNPQPKALDKVSARALLTKALETMKQPANKTSLLALLKECEDLPADQAPMMKLMKLTPAIQAMMAPVMKEYGFAEGDLMTVATKVQSFAAEDPSIAADVQKLMKAASGDLGDLLD